jgi:hypothetical protein
MNIVKLANIKGPVGLLRVHDPLIARALLSPSNLEGPVRHLRVYEPLIVGALFSFSLLLYCLRGLLGF